MFVESAVLISTHWTAFPAAPALIFPCAAVVVMAEALIGGFGCLTGAALWHAILSLRSKKAAGSVDIIPLGSPNAAASPWGRHSKAPWSPLAFMSPMTHLRRSDDFTQVKGVSSDVSLSPQPADLSKIGGVARDLDKARFIGLLRRLLSQSKYLQNNPRLGIVPEEKRAAKVVMEELAPFSKEKGGPLIIEELEYTPGRSNLKVTYPGSTDKTIAFVGSHFDVVPADPSTWDKDPFELTEEDGKLFGRGTTDCLGHVALITRFLSELGRMKPKLKRTIVVLFIAGEEGGEKNVGVDEVVRCGKLEEIKNGPVYWVDCADSQPCCGTSGMLSWSIKCTGRLFHSGFPNKGINSIELAMEACNYIQQRFYEDFPPMAQEEAYQFATGSHMKPTQIECAKGSLNQICPETTVSGDVRLSPFYEVDDVKASLERYVKELNDNDLEMLPTKGKWSKFVLEKGVMTQPGELRRGHVELKWQGDIDSFKLYAGIAVSLESEGHKALVQSFREVNGDVKPFSVNGSLPLVKMMQKQGFDIQLCGFGLMSVYHGVNEYCTIQDMRKAYEVLLRIVCLLEASSG